MCNIEQYSFFVSLNNVRFVVLRFYCKQYSFFPICCTWVRRLKVSFRQHSHTGRNTRERVLNIFLQKIRSWCKKFQETNPFCVLLNFFENVKTVHFTPCVHLLTDSFASICLNHFSIKLTKTNKHIKKILFDLNI